MDAFAHFEPPDCGLRDGELRTAIDSALAALSPQRNFMDELNLAVYSKR
jgi:hypothetical protein